MISVGLDVHVRTTTVAAKDRQGRVLARGAMPNTPEGLAKRLAPVVRAAGPDAGGELEPVRIVLESTTNSRALAKLCADFGKAAGIDLRVDVLDARKLRVIAESVAKSDARDAAMLCDLAAANLRLPTCYVPDDAVFELRELLRARADLVRLRTALKNRIHAVLHRRCVLRPEGVDLFAADGRQWLAGLELDAAGRAIAEAFLRCVALLDAEGKALLKLLLTAVKAERWRKPCAFLRSIPGVGPITALTILAELGEATRFRGRAAVANYAGLVPRVRVSNGKGGHGGITRHGPAHLRAMLAESAWVAKRVVPQYQLLFDRVAARRGKSIAITAVARRLLEDAWTLWRKGEPFRPATPPKPETPAPSASGSAG